ncbi:FAD dependent oxidoreductase [Colletotrichum scovillei]|uniref:FAD dependent oxidoreductase n=1 Tax=Colletotrichum scovillei TaxID=1209932 RepID=A0A9P7UL53_9PEZI|nr:FAD dependent oxidoreductase [Colletotrichum scovillei]KAG7077689.1 FAD dependent oxidoreductase [Colletotrichum scovillei]KAG7084740.1 FAD dependent oxidoreductase [Colletotrichum scovillei]
MGSPYLLAHGNGKPVADATTTISAEKGRYNVWVRTKDWVPAHHPGQFTLTINGNTLDTVFGANGKDWHWQYAGTVNLPWDGVRLVLHDLTGFCGCCDAVFLSKEDTSPPNGIDGESRAWRRRLRGLPHQPHDAGSFDVVVVGGGIPGCTAALAAARMGDRVALFKTVLTSAAMPALAPIVADEMHHGHTVFFRTRMGDKLAPFPSVPWATEVAKDYSDLRGQLSKPGLENGPGPLVVPPNFVPDPTMDMKMKGPLTHFWEYGQWLDPYTNGEHIRDHLLRAIYGTFQNVKEIEPETYANLEFDWILTETDIRDHKVFPDAVVQNAGAFCLHYPGDKKYDFRLQAWEWDERDKKPYDIPFRCLYSSNISNLMMAGKHISTTHIGGSNAKFMANGGCHALATAAAAHLCIKHQTNPRGIYENHLPELKATIIRQGQGIWDRKSDNRL